MEKHGGKDGNFSMRKFPGKGLNWGRSFHKLHWSTTWRLLYWSSNVRINIYLLVNNLAWDDETSSSQQSSPKEEQILNILYTCTVQCTVCTKGLSKIHIYIYLYILHVLKNSTALMLIMFSRYCKLCTTNVQKILK